MYIRLKWRLLSLAGLAVYALAVVVVVLIVVHNPAFALVLGPTAAFLAYAIWLYFAETGRSKARGRWALVVAIVALVMELAFFARDVANVRAAIMLLVLAGLYVWLVSIMRKMYWRERRLAGRHTSAPADFQRPFLVINPKSGNGRAMKAHVDVVAREMGVETKILEPGEDMETVARQAAKQGADVLGVSGGDGSIGAVAKVALEFGLPMVVLPGGTRCHFARDLGLDRSRIVDSLEGFHGVERHIDAGSINGRIFLNNVSFGLYADIVDNQEYRDNKLRVSREVLRQLMDGTKEPYDLRFKHGTQRFRRAVQVLVGVNRYRTLSLLELGHRERLDGGVLQVTVVAKLNDALIRNLIRTFGIGHWYKQRPLPDFYQWDTPTFDVMSGNDELVVGVDGEREVYQTPVEVRIMPGALSIYVPSEGVRNRPKSAFSGFMLKRLWRAATRRSLE